MSMLPRLRAALIVVASLTAGATIAQTQQRVVDVPTRPGVTERLLVLTPPTPKAAVILLPGGHGGLQMQPEGSIRWGDSNFLVRTRQLFADQGLMVALMDAPSDRQLPPYLGGFRQTPEHASDLKAVIAWMRENAKVPVWLVGTSRGTQSAGYVATQLTGADGPDGVVLTSTILTDKNSRPVPAMSLGKLKVPVLVVHHEEDGCSHCRFADVPTLMSQLSASPRAELIAATGGFTRGDPCEAQAYHGFSGVESKVVQQIAAWITK